MAASKINTLPKRRKLAPRTWPYWETIARGRSLGFYRSEAGGAWHARLTREDGTKATKALGGDITSDFDKMASAARAWFDQIERSPDARFTVNQAVADYVADLKTRRSERTAREVLGRLDKHLLPVLGKVELAELTTRQLEQWLNSMVKASEDPEAVRKSKDSANRVLIHIKAALNLAYRRDMVATDRAWKNTRAFENADAARRVFLTDAQVSRLLKATAGGFHALIKAAVLTGARYGELIRAKVSDLDLINGTLHLSGKTGSRDVYLSSEALAFFKETARGRLPSAWLLTRDDGEPWAESHQNRRMKRAVRAARCPSGTVFYSLRHFHISKALLAGVNVQVVAENTGTSLRMIEKHYGKFRPDDRRAMFDAVQLGT